MAATFSLSEGGPHAREAARDVGNQSILARPERSVSAWASPSASPRRRAGVVVIADCGRHRTEGVRFGPGWVDVAGTGGVDDVAHIRHNPGPGRIGSTARGWFPGAGAPPTSTSTGRLSATTPVSCRARGGSNRCSRWHRPHPCTPTPSACAAWPTPCWPLWPRSRSRCGARVAASSITALRCRPTAGIRSAPPETERNLWPEEAARPRRQSGVRCRGTTRQ